MSPTTYAASTEGPWPARCSAARYPRRSGQIEPLQAAREGAGPAAEIDARHLRAAADAPQSAEGFAS